MDEDKVREYERLKEQYKRDASPLEPPPILDRGSPLGSAREFLARRWSQQGFRTLHFYRGEFYGWNDSIYKLVDEYGMRSDLYSFLDSAQRFESQSRRSSLVSFEPNKRTVDGIVDALKAETFLKSDIEPPIWLDSNSFDPPGEELLPCANGILHLPTRRLIPHTPRLFALNGVGYDYEPGASAPVEWMQFLGKLWPDDIETIETLQEIMGYLLTGDTRQQKIFLIVGPKRAGKGTIARVIGELVGWNNVVAPTLAGLATNFGLAPLIGKQVAIIGDARLSGRSDQAIIAERLLSISGEDAQTIDRKHDKAWTGRLPIRFILLTNELPRLTDVSGALASRFIVLCLTMTFLGREDIGLPDRLIRELPGMLVWSLAGRERLYKRGRFSQPSSSQDAVQSLDDLGSPTGAFLRECCVIGPEYEVERDKFFEAWRAWCREQGREHPGTKESFGRDLKAAIPAVKSYRPRRDGTRLYRYQGVGLREPPRDSPDPNED